MLCDEMYADLKNSKMAVLVNFYVVLCRFDAGITVEVTV